jgi:hypothetical protein
LPFAVAVVVANAAHAVKEPSAGSSGVVAKAVQAAANAASHADSKADPNAAALLMGEWLNSFGSTVVRAHVSVPTADTAPPCFVLRSVSFGHFVGCCCCCCFCCEQWRCLFYEPLTFHRGIRTIGSKLSVWGVRPLCGSGRARSQGATRKTAKAGAEV